MKPLIDPEFREIVRWLRTALSALTDYLSSEFQDEVKRAPMRWFVPDTQISGNECGFVVFLPQRFDAGAFVALLQRLQVFLCTLAREWIVYCYDSKQSADGYVVAVSPSFVVTAKGIDRSEARWD